MSKKADDNEDFGGFVSPPADVFAFTEQRSCADILRMSESGILDRMPAFQRKFIWKDRERARFIDSLLKNLPIPSMCFTLDKKTKIMQVVDGVQRISTILDFLSGRDSYRISKLKDVDSRISGKTLGQIKRDNPEVIEQIQNIVISTTVIRWDQENVDHNEYVFQIFHRLNTGGSKLNAQEIRNCIYSGTLNTAINKLAEEVDLSSIYGVKDEKIRGEKSEIILRFCALMDESAEYKPSLATFLNKYMFKNRHLDQEAVGNKLSLFLNAVTYVESNQLLNKKTSQNSKSVVEAILIGIAKNINSVRSLDKSVVLEKIDLLFEQTGYTAEDLKNDVMSAGKVKNRIDSAISAFSS